MARKPRIILVGNPHYIFQHSERNQAFFVTQIDYEVYIELLFKNASAFAVEIISYALLPHQIHLIIVPSNLSGAGQMIGSVHEKFSKYIRRRHPVKTLFPKNRFMSFPMTEDFLSTAIQCLLQCPVLERVCADQSNYPWSGSLLIDEDLNLPLITDQPLSQYIIEIKKHLKSGRPLGDAAFLSFVESAIGRNLSPRKRGRKPQLKQDHPSSL